MKPRIAITADTYMDATNSTNLQRAPYVSRELVEVLSALDVFRLFYRMYRMPSAKTILNYMMVLLFMAAPM